MTGPEQANNEAHQPESPLQRLKPILAGRIAEDMPGTDHAMIEDVVGKALDLLAGSATTNRTHPLADATVWLLAHALEDPHLHRAVLPALQWELPGLTLNTEDFHRDAALFRTPGHDTGPQEHPR